jgi:hypothetical protein
MYQLLLPRAELAPYIENYWSVQSPEGDVDLNVDVFVGAQADLIFNFGVAYTRQASGGQPTEYLGSNLDAQRDHPIRIRQKGRISIVGVRFRTGGLGPFLKVPAVDLTNQTVEPRLALGEAMVDLERSLATTQDSAAQKLALDDAFLAALPRGAPGVFFDLKTKYEAP